MKLKLLLPPAIVVALAACQSVSRTPRPSGLVQGLAPLAGFVENQGQFPREVRFAYFSAYIVVAFEDKGFRVVYSDGVNEYFGLPCPSSCRLLPLAPRSTRVSWQVGPPQRWRPGLRTFSRLRYEGLANGVSVEFYPHPKGLEFDIYAPSPKALEGFALRREEPGSQSLAQGVEFSPRTKLARDVLLLAPMRRRDVKVLSDARATTFSFRLPEGLPNQPVHLDPVLQWGSYWAFAGEFVDVAAGDDGTLFILGSIAGLSLDDPVPRSNHNVLLAAVSAHRSQLLWVTVFGGTWDEVPRKLAVGPEGLVVSVGATTSSDFPVSGDAFAKKNFGARVGFITGHSPKDGSLVFSSFFLNPKGTPPFASISVDDIAVEPSGDIFVAGQTYGPGIPVTPAAFQPFPQGLTDWFLARLAPRARSVRWCTYLGGSSSEDGRPHLALDSHLNVLVAGTTSSLDLPVTLAPPGAFASPRDLGYVARFTPGGFLDGASAVVSKYRTQVAGVLALDDRAAAIVGSFYGSEFPQKNPVADGRDFEKGMFFARLSFESQSWEQVTVTPIAVASSIAWSEIEVVGAALDRDGNLAFVANTNVPNLVLPSAYRCSWPTVQALTAVVGWLNPKNGQFLEGSLAGPGHYVATGMAAGPEHFLYVVGKAENLPDPYPVPGGNDPPCHPPCGREGAAALVLEVRRGDPALPRISWEDHPHELTAENFVELDLKVRLDRPWPEPILVSIFGAEQPVIEVPLSPGQVEATIRVTLFGENNELYACLPENVSGCCAATRIVVRRPPRLELQVGSVGPLYPGEVTTATVSLLHVASEARFGIQCFAEPSGVMQVPAPFELVGATGYGSYRLEALSPGTARLWCEARGSDGALIRSQDVVFNVSWPPPQHVRFLPVALHQPGADNSQWRTVVSLFNGYRMPQQVSVRWVQTGQEKTVTVPPHGLVRFEDFLVEAFGLDPRSTANGSFLFVSQGKLTAVCQVVNDTARGTYGQSFPLSELSWPAGYSHTVVLPLLKGGERFRSNIGVFSPSITARCRGRLNIYDARGTPLTEYPVDLPPLGWQQFNQVLGTGSEGARLGYALLAAEEGSACRAYASIIDRHTGDPTTLVLPWDWSQGVVPVIAQTPGALGSNWGTELAVLLYRPFETTSSVRLTFQPQGSEDAKVIELSGLSGTLKHFENVATELLGYPKDARVLGSLTFEPRESFIAARLYNLTPGGTLGQEIPAHPAFSAQMAAIPGLVHDGRFRSNIGFFVPFDSQTLGTPRATVRFYDGAGNPVGRSLRFELKTGWTQVNGVLADAGLAESGYVTAVVDAWPSIWTYASVVDNRSGDPTLIEADPLCLNPDLPCPFRIALPPP
ncbi:MAG: hypothetical protein ACP5NF_07255 [Thermoanaerobaculum sp.]